MSSVGKGEEKEKDRRKSEEEEGEWGSLTHQFRLKSCTAFYSLTYSMFREFVNVDGGVRSA